MTRDQFDSDARIVEKFVADAGARRERHEALSRLQEAAFQVGDRAFPREEYKRILKKLFNDPDDEIRDAVLSELAIQRDPDVQALLLEVLDGDKDLKISKARAIQLLASDTHGAHFERCRAIAENDASEVSERIEAVRALALDAASEGLLVRVMMNDRGEAVLRLWAGLSLRTLAPRTFAPLADRIGVDAREPRELRDMCEVALQSSPTLRTFL